MLIIHGVYTDGAKLASPPHELEITFCDVASTGFVDASTVPTFRIPKGASVRTASVSNQNAALVANAMYQRGTWPAL